VELTAQKRVILYADISGSTRLYEQHGDQIARAAIKSCLDMLSEIVIQHDGQVVKSIGDEIMCSFVNPVKAQLAAIEMHQNLQSDEDMEKSPAGKLHIKISWHYGDVNHRGKEIIGEAPVTAQQMIQLAKADEILTSEQGLRNLPAELKENINLIDTLDAEAYDGKLEVYSIPWEETDEITKIESSLENISAITQAGILILEYREKTIRLDTDNKNLNVGRSTDSGLNVEGNYTSRLHAEIQYRHGRFHLKDMSTNGTAIIYSNGEIKRIHREELVLKGEGTICFGGLPEEDPDASVYFKCVMTKK
jgi:hypothetical protein